MEDRGLSRREFLSRSAYVAAGLVLGACSGRDHVPVIRPAFGTEPGKVDTRWPVKRVVYLMLENRSFDAMFGRYPGVNGVTTGIREGREVPLRRCPEWLPGDLPHDRWSAELAYNEGKMDGFALGQYADYCYTQFAREDIPNYYHWAENYVLCDNFYASMLGPSYPNHLFMIAGTGGGAIDNPENTQVRRGKDKNFKSWGCDAYGDNVYVLVEDDDGNVTKHDTCFNFKTQGEQLSERGIDWSFYSPDPHQAGYIWNAYSAIDDVYHSELWDEHIWPVDHLLEDIEAEALPSVTWIVPRFQLSDHPPYSTCHAHNWVTDIVNRIMRSSMWEETAIFITWDEWGGMYDHVKPPTLGVHEVGFRVPMLVISPYAKRGYVDDGFAEFTGPARFIADNFDLPYLTGRFEDTHNFEHVFNFDRPPRPPDPRPKKKNCYGKALYFPDDYPGWPEGIEPTEPNILSQ